MIGKTEGICLNYIKFKESSIIVRCYTRDHGLQSYVVNSVRSPKAKKKLGFFEPLTVLEIVYYESKTSDLHRLSEYRPKKTHPSIRFDIKKSTITLFLSEFLSKVLSSEPGGSHELYEFILHSISSFEELTEGFENFHLQFILKLSKYFGFGFDPETMHLPGNREQIDQYAAKLVATDYSAEIPASGALRSESLEAIIAYYSRHTGQAFAINSLDVLKRVFN